MEYIFGKRPAAAAQNGANTESSAVDSHLLGSASPATRQPCGATLKMFARSFAGKVIGHPLTKTVAGPLFFLGTRINCLGLDNNWFGEYAALVAAGGITLLVLSTVLSTCNKPRYEPLVKHLAQSTGYFVAGGPLAILQLITWLRCRGSLQEFDAEQITQQIAQDYDPVLDGPANQWDTPVDVELSPHTETDWARTVPKVTQKSQRNQEDAPV